MQYSPVGAEEGEALGPAVGLTVGSGVARTEKVTVPASSMRFSESSSAVQKISSATGA